MVLFVPDISHHQEDISIQGLINDGAAALIARVGQGAGRTRGGKTYGTTRDRKWARNMVEANRLGLPLIPYWYVGNLLSADENARQAAEWVGDTSLPWMIDHEDASGSIDFYREVLAAFARRGLRVVLGYVPHWYWSAVGKGSLAGPPLVNSAYPGGTGGPAQIYGDGSRHAAGWVGYGGNAVALLQFTNQASMAGQRVDCSAFPGTPTELAALLGAPKEEDDMPILKFARTNDNPDVWAGDGVTRRRFPPGSDVFFGTADLFGISRDAVIFVDDLDVLGVPVAEDIAELKARPVADVDEAALAAELEARGWDPATAAEVKEIVLSAFARAGQPDGGTA